MIAYIKGELVEVEENALETIVCLPNQVVAEVKGAGNPEGEDAKGLDAVAH